MLLVISGIGYSSNSNNDNSNSNGKSNWDDEKSAAPVVIANAAEACDGRVKELTTRRGIIQTPNFPNAFAVPIHCRWLINASDYANETPVVYVYFTQLFVKFGLTITEYGYFDTDNEEGIYKREIFNAVDSDVLRYEFSRTNLAYLMIDFQLDRLEDNHLRVLYHLMDVYGFNITYEITKYEPRDKRCTVSDCSLVGHCYANYDFS